MVTELVLEDFVGSTVWSFTVPLYRVVHAAPQGRGAVPYAGGRSLGLCGERARFRSREPFHTPVLSAKQRGWSHAQEVAPTAPGTAADTGPALRRAAKPRASARGS